MPGKENVAGMKRQLLAFLLLASVAWADSTLEGKFVRIETGDYSHIVVLDAKGKEHSYFVGNDKSFDPLIAHPEKFKNKRVRVRWHSVTREIPEAGGKLKIDEAVSVKVL